MSKSLLSGFATLVVAAMVPALAAQQEEPRRTEVWEPEPPIVDPGDLSAAHARFSAPGPGGAGLGARKAIGQDGRGFVL